MFESVDDHKSSRSIRRTPETRLWVARRENCFQHWTESSRIPASRKSSVWRKMKAQKEDRLLRGRQIAYLIYEYFRFTGAKRFCRKLCRPIYNCSSKWRHSVHSIRNGRTSITNDANPIWGHLGKLVQIKNTRVWETQDGIGIVQYGDSSSEKRTWLPQIENYGEKKYRAGFYETRILRPERKLWKKRRGQESGTEQREQRTLGDCWQWKTNGQSSKGDNCSVRHDINKREKSDTAESVSEFFHAAEWAKSVENPKSQSRSPSGRMFRWPCKDYLHQIILWRVASSRNAYFSSPRVDADLVKSALMRIARLKNSLVEDLRRMVTKVQWPCSKEPDNWVACFKIGATEVYKDFAEELKHTEANPMSNIHESRCTSCWHSRPKSIVRTYLPRWTSSA